MIPTHSELHVRCPRILKSSSSKVFMPYVIIVGAMSYVYMYICRHIAQISCCHLISSLAYYPRVPMVWVYAIAVWFEGSLSILSCLYVTKLEALSEWDAYLMSMNEHDRLFWSSVNTFVYRHARSERTVLECMPFSVL